MYYAISMILAFICGFLVGLSTHNWPLAVAVVSGLQSIILAMNMVANKISNSR